MDWNKCWIKLRKIIERERYGEVRVKIQDGVPVSLPPQLIERINKDGSHTKTEITKAIDLGVDDGTTD